MAAELFVYIQLFKTENIVKGAGLTAPLFPAHLSPLSENGVVLEASTG